jgi:gamma-tubulin complex component 5
MAHASIQGSSEISLPSNGNFERLPLRAKQGWSSEKGRDLDDSDEGEFDREGDFSIIYTPDTRLSYIDELREMRSHYDRLCRFVASGLRSVARAGGEPNWDMLADKLDNNGLALQYN